MHSIPIKQTFQMNPEPAQNSNICTGQDRFEKEMEQATFLHNLFSKRTDQVNAFVSFQNWNLAY